MKRIIIIDDEKDARILIRQYLEPYDNFEIVAECTNGIEAINKINQLEPDLVFLDIQMPGKNGFQVIQEIVHVPQVIFTTAYDQYALRAFENNAIDYLLKPYTLERFTKAVAKISLFDSQNFSKAKMVAEEAIKKYPIRLLVETGNKLVNLDVMDIYYLEAERDYTKIYTREKSYLSTYGIGVMEQRLDPQLFLRIHRSYIVNINHINEVNKENNSAQIKMNNNAILNVSRSYWDAFKKHIY